MSATVTALDGAKNDGKDNSPRPCQPGSFADPGQPVFRIGTLHFDVPHLQGQPLPTGLQLGRPSQTSQRQSADRGVLFNLQSVLADHRRRTWATCQSV